MMIASSVSLVIGLGLFILSFNIADGDYIGFAGLIFFISIIAAVICGNKAKFIRPTNVSNNRVKYKGAGTNFLNGL